MGKLKDLLDEYKTCGKGTPREAEVIADIYKIVDWMKENGHMTKPFKLPRKGGWSYGAPMNFNKIGEVNGTYCGHCGDIVELTENICKCGWGLGVVYLVQSKDLNTRIRRV